MGTSSSSSMKKENTDSSRTPSSATTMPAIASSLSSLSSSSASLLSPDKDCNNSMNDVNVDDNEWKVGNWCWERDYNKYPVSFNDHNMNKKRCIKGMTKYPSSNNEDVHVNSNGDDNDDDNDDDNHDDDDNDDDDKENDEEKKPSATDHQRSDDGDLNRDDSFFDDWVEGNWCLETTAAAAVTRDEEPVHCDGNNSDNDNDGIDDNNDNDNSYDDWVVGNWCLIDNYTHKNISSGSNSNDKKRQQHESQVTKTATVIVEDKRKSSRDDDDEKRQENLSSRKRNRRNTATTTTTTTTSDDDTTTNKRKRHNSIVLDEESDKNNNEEDDGDDDSGINNDDDDDDDDLSPYERLRLARIKRNEERLKSLGLGGGCTAISNRNTRKNNKNTKKRKVNNNEVRVLRVITPREKSQRIQYNEEQWTHMYYNLVEYNKIHAHNTIEGPDLEQWASEQRRAYRNGELRHHRITVLNSIEFQWEDKYMNNYFSINSSNEEWMGMFRRFVVFKEGYKNIMVGVNYNKDPSLKCWVTCQRQFYKNDKLLPNRVELLDSIEFEWDGVKAQKQKFDQVWMYMYHKLVAYKKCYKTTMVTQRYDHRLSNWVARQRVAYSNDTPPDRINLLNSIGFDWKWKKKERKNSG